jgi:hypothetical protein
MIEQEQSKGLWPTYALRAWLSSLVAQVRSSRSEAVAQIEHHEVEVARLRRQLERSDEVLRALSEVTDLVDDRLRRVRDSESYPVITEGVIIEEQLTPDAPSRGKERGGQPHEKAGGRPGNH